VADRVLHAAVLGYLLALGLAAAALWAWSDVWWPATILLFGPRWVLLLPLALLVPWAAVRDRALLWPLSLALLIGLGPLLGVRSGWRGLLGEGAGERFRVATFNAAGGDRVAPLGTLLADWDADVAVFQECGGALREQVLDLERAGFPLYTHSEASLCVTSRHPIVATSAMEREVFEFAGGSALVQTYTIDWSGRSVAITNVHLETQRAGLDLFRRGRILDAIPQLKEKSLLREIELRTTRRWVDSVPEPRIVMGDFNTPPESRIYRSAWSDWTSAFDARGSGAGGTRLNGWIRARIDHILVDQAWRVADVRVADDAGSDHLPVVATLRAR
jgi:endonuclease/exonuclease/phosphatase (EEP) superfamily protein YafD